jgi:Fic family protein
MKLSSKEIEFLQQSNYLEGEYDNIALEDAKKAWIYAKSNRKTINLDYILQIHKKLMIRLNPDIAGKLRDCAVYIGGRTCEQKPRQETEKEINSWLKNYYQKSKTMESIINSHISFEHLHPFRDGNGRTGRILMNVQMLNAKLPLIIIHEGTEQSAYYRWFK